MNDFEMSLYKDVSQNALSNIHIDYNKWDMEMLFTKQRRNDNWNIFFLLQIKDWIKKSASLCKKPFRIKQWRSHF